MAVRVDPGRAEAARRAEGRGRAGEPEGAARAVQIDRSGAEVQGPRRGRDRPGGDGRARPGRGVGRRASKAWVNLTC